jgi:hypothetical protein
MRLHHVLGVIFLACAVPAGAQERLQLDTLQHCSYYGERLQEELYGFASDEAARSFVSEIMRYTGLPQNFEIMAANVPNASAVIDAGKRLILYSQGFMRDITNRAGTDWAATSIMAHEVGHHLAGHTLAGGSRPPAELQADQFSGHVLFKMGATLEQAKVAMELVAGQEGSTTHPPKGARLAAIHNGWLAAQEQSGKTGTASPTVRVEEKAPAHVPPPASASRDLTGNWQTSLNSVWQVTPAGGSRFAIVEYNLLGATGAMGEAALNGSRVDATIGVPFVFAFQCVFTLVDESNMRGQCSLNGQVMNVALTR